MKLKCVKSNSKLFIKDKLYTVLNSSGGGYKVKTELGSEIWVKLKSKTVLFEEVKGDIR